MSALTDATTYPISPATARHLERDSFRLVLEVLWDESKVDVVGYLTLVGGRGPGL